MGIKTIFYFIANVIKTNGFRTRSIMMRLLLFIGTIFILQGCGTVQTVFQDDYSINKNLIKNETKCKSISRVYSGVSYDFCRFHAEPELGVTGPGTNLYLFDILFFSPVLDTILLPITIFHQINYGNLELSNPY